jgi:hypothetical protein
MNSIFKLSNWGDVEWLLGTKPPPHEGEDYDGYEGIFAAPTRDKLGHHYPRKYWRFDAFQSGGIERAAVLILVELEESFFNERDRIKAIDEARIVFQEAHLLYRPAVPAEIAKALGDLADILNQELSEKAAGFIIGLFLEAKMSPLMVNHICHNIACNEQGRLKPHIFNSMIQHAEIRYKEMRKILSMFDDAYRIFDEALKLALEKEPGIFGAEEPLEF